MSERRTREELQVSYTEKHAFLLGLYGNPVPCRDFYSDLFGEGFLQEAYKVNSRAPHDGRPVAIANVIHVSKKDARLYRRNHYVADGFEALEKLENYVAYVAPCSFIGGAKDLEHLRFIHALVVDLDYVGSKQIVDLDYQIGTGYVPRPTYIVNSGTGLHLYYVFNQPQPAWPNKRPGYVALKRALINLCWNEFTSQSTDRQFSGLVQPYRVIGSRSKLDCDPQANGRVETCDWTVFAFRTGEKWTLDALLDFEPITDAGTGRWGEEIGKARRVFRPDADPEHLTLEAARDRYPEWYERRIVRGEEPIPRVARGKWHVNKRVYDWWFRRIRLEAVPGHRYFCIMMLAVYAVKCDVPYEQLKHDAYSLLDTFEARTNDETNHFYPTDVEQALHAYWNKSFATLPIGSIEHFSGLRIERNQTRKGRTQEVHLMGARAIQEINDKVNGTNWRDGNGRKPKKDLVRDYAAAHPEANHSQIARELGISRPTVIKWLRDWTPPNAE